MTPVFVSTVIRREFVSMVFVEALLFVSMEGKGAIVRTVEVQVSVSMEG